MQDKKIYDLCEELENLEKDYRRKADYKRNKRFNKRFKGISKGLMVARWKIWDLYRRENVEIPDDIKEL